MRVGEAGQCHPPCPPARRQVTARKPEREPDGNGLFTQPSRTPVRAASDGFGASSEIRGTDAEGLLRIVSRHPSIIAKGHGKLRGP